MGELENKFEEWEGWIFGGDIHSLRNQISNMIWDAAVFLTINEARKYAPTNDKGDPQLNDATHGLINRCFFRTQVSMIRSILDRRTDVVSLWHLIVDMESNRKLLTRENILAAHGYPYDFKKKRAELNQIRLQKGSDGVKGKDLINCAHSKQMHKNIDFIAGISPSERKPNDTFRREVFEWLQERLSGLKIICDYVNKFLAHSATPESRASIKADEIKPTLGRVLDAHKVICETAEFVSMKILNQGFGNFLAIPQYDQLKYFDKPWVSEDALKKLDSFWNQYDKETRKWLHWDWQKEFNEYYTA